MADTHPIEKYRKRNGLTVRQLAKVIGVNASTITRWELREREIDPRRVKDISALLGISKRALRPDVFG